MNRANLRKWRLARGWTQRDAAKWWGCHKKTWQRYELGLRRIPNPLIRQIKRELGKYPPRRLIRSW